MYNLIAHNFKLLSFHSESKTRNNVFRFRKPRSNPDYTSKATPLVKPGPSPCQVGLDPSTAGTE